MPSSWYAVAIPVVYTVLNRSIFCNRKSATICNTYSIFNKAAAKCNINMLSYSYYILLHFATNPYYKMHRLYLLHFDAYYYKLRHVILHFTAALLRFTYYKLLQILYYKMMQYYILPHNSVNAY